jgi:hypothetical protein
MKAPLLSDIRKDKRFLKNTLRILFFLLLIVILDKGISSLILKGINKNYGLNSNAKMLLLGHSHLMLALDKYNLENEIGISIAKYTREGVNISDRRIMLDHYFETCSSKPDIVILGIDPWLFSSEGLSSNSYLLFLPFMDKPEINDYIKSSIPDSFTYYKYKLVKSSRFNATLLNASIRGYLRDWSNLKTGVIDSLNLKRELSAGKYRRITFDNKLINDFTEILNFLSTEKTEVILLNTPIWAPLTEVQKKEYDTVLNMIDSIRSVHCPSAKLINLDPVFSGKSNYFFDPIHMNPYGQKAVTDYVSVMIKNNYVNNGNAKLNIQIGQKKLSGY